MPVVIRLDRGCYLSIDLTSRLVSLAVGLPRPRSHPGIGEDQVARVYNFKSFREICNAFTFIPFQLAGAVLCGAGLAIAFSSGWPYAAAALASRCRRGS